MRITCICFDIGGVLVRVRLHLQEILTEIAAKTKYTHLLHKASFLKLSDLPLIEDFESGKCSEEDYLHALSTFLQIDTQVALECHMQVLAQPFQGTLELVKELKKHSIYTSCLSNTNKLHWGKLSNPLLYPAVSWLDKQVVSFECGFMKPHREIYERFEVLTGFKGAQILYFEDNERNVAAARELGWRVQQIDPSRETVPQIHEALRQYQLLA
jgi:putative hydrolase of the HAD superfamily